MRVSCKERPNAANGVRTGLYPSGRFLFRVILSSELVGRRKRMEVLLKMRSA